MVECPMCKAKYLDYGMSCPKCGYSKESEVIKNHHAKVRCEVQASSWNIFDCSFSSYTAPNILKLSYLLMVLLLGGLHITLYSFLGSVTQISQGSDVGIIFLLLLSFVVSLFSIRVVYEFVLAVIRIEKNTRNSRRGE